jgi:hypothetical protein
MLNLIHEHLNNGANPTMPMLQLFNAGSRAARSLFAAIISRRRTKASDCYAHLNRTRAVENGRQHHDAMLSEGKRLICISSF